MKILLLRGGLGNQLFIYGAYNFLKKKYPKHTYIDDVSGFLNDIVYKRKNKLPELGFSYKKIGKNIRIIWRILALFKDDTSFLFFCNRYYQEAFYLDNIKMQLSENLSRICVHIRIKNYPLMLLESEYIELIDYAKKKFQHLTIIFLTDDESLFKKEMPVLSALGECLDLDEIEAFYFMAQSSHVIISDSSFSFSSAYIGKEKVILYKRLTNIIVNGSKQHQWIKL